VGGARLHWTGEVYPYVKNLQLYACPASNTDAYMIPPGGWGPDPMVYSDYAMNGCLGAMGGGGGCITGWLIPLKQAAIYRPAEMIMLKATDGPGWFYTYNPDKAYAEGAYVGPNPWDSAAYNPNWKWPNIETRHNNGGNFAFVDGHAKWMSREKAYAFDGSGGWNNTP